MGEKVKLAIDRIWLSALPAFHVMSIACQMMRFLFVRQLNVKDVLQAMNQLGIDDREVRRVLNYN